MKKISWNNRKIGKLFGIFGLLILMFLVLKLFFFPDFLKTHFKTDAERSNYVIEQLTK